ncbi:hypothetical protein AB3Z07_27820 (plasmid) [Metabacillus halosaccharovorans]|uniref:hypothetical protein n=1 Tax=Metabacillus halosaccharovorans TaxID=930124 RepID=UPI00203F0A4B|nr:hypothetical protein [Metabacillus halosaccharovorans]MCM3441370.1 hypothetical protein [Metabacillus halosaccharovorans]
MTNQTNTEIEEIPYFFSKEGEIPFWDHPLLSGYKLLPKGYKPYTTIEAVLSLCIKGIIKEEDMMVLKVLGDAICCNEEQLRRYLSSKMSRSDVSKKLNKFRIYGLVDRWKVRIRSDEEEKYKPPAPFTIGIAGYKLLKHYYNHEFFMDPNKWDSLGIGAVQRYVAMNELRCQLVERKAIANWKWNALVENNRLIRKPLGIAEIKTPRGKLNFLIERAQMNQDFLGFLRDKLKQWKTVYENNNKNIKVDGFEQNNIIITIFTSTLSIAEVIQRELLLDTLPFKVFICVEEDLVKDSLATSFYLPTSEALVRKELSFFK